MARARHECKLVIILCFDVFVPDHKAERASKGPPILHPTYTLHYIILFPRGGQGRLSRSPTSEFFLKFLHVDGKIARKTFNNASNSSCMRFSERHNSKQPTKQTHTLILYKIRTIIKIGDKLSMFTRIIIIIVAL